MDHQYNEDFTGEEEHTTWDPPRILETGKVEAHLFSDEPDPFG